MKIIGSFVSPYVRKVLVALELKGIGYEVDAITPFFGGDEFSRLSPLRRIPVMIDGDTTLCDSSVICAYLDDAYPSPLLVDGSPAERARQRWFEEYADTRLGDVFIWGLFYPKVVHPLVWGEPGDANRIRRSLDTDIPREMDYLEGELPDGGFLTGDTPGLGDIALASMLRSATYADFHPDRWPGVTAYAARVLALPAFAKLKIYEDIARSVTMRGRRQALLDAGAPLSADTIGQAEPQRGIMRL